MEAAVTSTYIQYELISPSFNARLLFEVCAAEGVVFVTTFVRSTGGHLGLRSMIRLHRKQHTVEKARMIWSVRRVARWQGAAI